MHTQHIRQMIAQATAQEEMTGTAAQALVQAAMLRGVPTSPLDVAQTVAFIRGYVEHAPDLLEACAAAAATAGIEDYVNPILESALQYFLSPLDVIYDHLGLIGLMDDAYFTQCLMQAVSEAYQGWTGSPLLPMNLAPANAVVRQLIGEPQASQLDLAVQSTLQQANVQQAFRGLTRYQQTLSVPEPAWADPDIEMAANPLSWIDPGAEPRAAPAEGDPFQRDAGAATDAAAAGEAAGFMAGYQMLLELFRQKAQAGEFTPERQQALETVLDELGTMLKNDPDDLAGMMSRMARVRELMGRMGGALETPTYEGGSAAVAGSRAATVERLLQGVKRYLVIEGTRPNKKNDESQAVQDLFVRAARLGTAINQAADDDEAVCGLEQQRVRKLAMDVRSYHLLNHLTLARPIWPAPPVVADPNGIFFSGGAALGRLLSEVCEARRLTVLSSRSGKRYAGARWGDLRRCNVAVFDFTAGEPEALAPIAYELGIALALGRNIVVVSGDGAVPFNVDIVPLQLQGDDGDGERLAGAVDEALYAQQRGGGDTSVPETIEYARGVFAPLAARFEIRHTLELLQEASEDPVKASHLMPELLGFVGREAPVPIYPAWPGIYPEPGARRCFHIMPFSLDWSDAVMALATAACKEAGCEYVRGDVAQDARIIRSIWDEIGRASHLVVDLTGFNANVALELGVAHVLGRATLIVGQDDTVDRLFPSLAKVRVHRYSLDSGGIELQKVLRSFLS
ncbi:MAG TPA: YkvA family protein [Gemmatimonadota bacterium]|nr:YkvA family protein [Gemmatimonadota bacterium]